MKKKIVSILLITTMVLSTGIGGIFAANKGYIRADGLLIDAANTIVSDNNTITQEAESVFQVLGITNYKIDLEAKTVWFTHGKFTVSLSVGSKTASVNGENKEMPVPVTMVNNKIYIPAKFIFEIFGAKTELDAVTNTLKIDTEFEDYSLITFSDKKKFEKNTTVLSLAEATSKAINKSGDIKKLEENIKNLEKQYKEANDAFKDFESDNSNLNGRINEQKMKVDAAQAALQKTADTAEEIGQINAMLLSIQQQDTLEKEMATYSSLVGQSAAYELTRMGKRKELQAYLDGIETTKITIKQIKDKTTYAIVQAANSIRSLEYNIVTFKTKLDIEQMNIKSMEVKVGLGLESEQNLKTAKNDHEINVGQLKNMEINLNNLKTTLNTTIGMKADDKVYVEAKQTFGFLTLDINDYALKASLNSSALKLNMIDQKSAEYSLTLFNGLSSTDKESLEKKGETKLSHEGAVTTAKLTASNTKSSVDKKVRDAYNNLKLKEEKFNDDKVAFDKAKDLYNSVAINYITGNATMYDVKLAELGLLSAETTLQNDKIDYSVARYAFEHPEVL